MARINGGQPEALWNEVSIESQAQDDLFRFGRARKTPLKYPIYPEELALTLWGTRTEYLDFPNSKKDVLAYFDHKQNVIFVNIAVEQIEQRTTFSLAHECGHISLHRFIADQRAKGGNWCHELRGHVGGNVIEWQANQLHFQKQNPQVFAKPLFAGRSFS